MHFTSLRVRSPEPSQDTKASKGTKQFCNWRYYGGYSYLSRKKRMEQERRRMPRYSFIATAEIVEERSEARIATRVSELSLQGCYLDMMNPFPTGTLVLVKIWGDAAYFEARARIAYAHEHLGVGITFLEVTEKFAPVLQGWLDEAERKSKLSEGGD